MTTCQSYSVSHDVNKSHYIIFYRCGRGQVTLNNYTEINKLYN